MRRTPFALALFVGVGLACCMRQDEFACENAVSHLQDCCQGFRAGNISCTYDDQGCSTIYPEFDVDQSNCILGESCATLVSSGVCSRATALPPFVANSNSYCPCIESSCSCSQQPTVRVCP